LLIAAQRLDAQPDRLELRAHLVKLLYISARADEVLRHNLACILRAIARVSETTEGDMGNDMGLEAHKLSRLGTFLDVHDELLLALLELCAFAVELALRLCQRALVLA
jgi:hypothetical protein